LTPERTSVCFAVFPEINAANMPKQVGIQRIIQRGPDMTEQVEAWLATEQEDEQS